MRVVPRLLITGVVVAGLLCALPQIVGATGTEPAVDPQVDPAACLVAITASDDLNNVCTARSSAMGGGTQRVTTTSCIRWRSSPIRVSKSLIITS